jgi:hypothetical protein
MAKRNHVEHEDTEPVELPASLPTYVSDEQLCELFHCSKVSLWRMRRRGELPPPIRLTPGKNSTRVEVVRAVLQQREEAAAV